MIKVQLACQNAKTTTSVNMAGVLWSRYFMQERGWGLAHIKRVRYCVRLSVTVHFPLCWTCMR